MSTTEIQAASHVDGVPVRWRPGRSVAISPDGAEVWHFGGAGPVRLSGLGAGRLAAAVDGQRTLEDVIVQAIEAGMEATEAKRIAHRWLSDGHLVPLAFESKSPVVRIVDRTKPIENGNQSGQLAARLGEALALAELVLLSEKQVSCSEGEADLTVFLLDDLLEVGSLSIQSDLALALQVRGEKALVSPLLGPGASCPKCLVERLRLRRSMDLVAAGRVGRELPPPSSIIHASVLPFISGVIAAMAHSCRPGTSSAELHRRSLTVVDPQTGRIEHHTLVPVAACPQCDPHGIAVVASHLKPSTLGAMKELDGSGTLSQNKELQSEAGFRVVDPLETWERFKPLISEIIGVVPCVTATGPRELRAFSAGSNVAAGRDLALLRSRLRAYSGGKGLTLAAARTGALAEALERDSLRARGNEPRRRARLAELEGALHPNDIQLFSAKQLHQAEVLEALGVEDPDNGRGFHRVPRPFDGEAEHDWSPVAELRTGKLRWMLSSLVWFNRPNLSPGYPVGSSNGAAAGNTLEEALLQGLMELVERDSVALWWYPRCRRPAIDLEAWKDPRIETALAPQKAIGTEVWVLDLTSDLGIPGAVAVAVGMKQCPQVPMLGFGAHLDPVVAVVRALTELAQMQAPLAAMVAGSAIEFPGSAERLWFSGVTPEREPWLAPAGKVAPAPSPIYRSLHEALEDAVGRIADRGLEVLWADCTRPDIGLPVVRTWVPGLRHFWNRFAPGRLYEVPPAIGWREASYSEEDLNPWAMIL